METQRIEAEWVIRDWKSPPTEGATLIIKGGEIVEIQEKRRGTGKGVAIIPGLVNAHIHIEFPYLILSHDFISWIKRAISFRNFKKFYDFFKNEQATIRWGTVAWGNIVPFPWKDGLSSSSGATVVPFLEILGDLDSPLPQAGFHLSPHSPYSITPELLKKIWTVYPNSLKAIHLAESQEEVAFIRGEKNRIEEEIFPLVGRRGFPRPVASTPVRYLSDLGALDSNTICIHGIFLSEDDALVLAERGSGLVICPRSNLYLSGRVAPVPLLKELGVPLAIGTDGLGSCPNLNLWEEMRTLWFLAKERRWDLTAEEILFWSSQGGATLLRLEGLTSLKPGGESSFLVVEVPPHLSPEDLPLYTLMQGDRHLKYTYIKGEKGSSLQR